MKLIIQNLYTYYIYTFYISINVYYYKKETIISITTCICICFRNSFNNKYRCNLAISFHTFGNVEPIFLKTLYI